MFLSSISQINVILVYSLKVGPAINLRNLNYFDIKEFNMLIQLSSTVYPRTKKLLVLLTIPTK
jgi:hypothetical protein